MTEYVRISMPSRSDAARASPTGRTLKPRMTASEAAASMTSDSVMPPTPELMTSTRTSSCGRRAISSSKRLQRTGHVGLEDQRELLGLALLDALEDLVEGHLATGAAGLGLVAQPDGALVGLLAGRAVVVDDADGVAGVGDAVEAEDLDRVAGHGLLDALAGVVRHRPHLAPVRAGDERVADVERAALDEKRDDGAAARVELGLDDDAGGVGVRVRLELLELGDDEDRVEQVLEALARACAETSTYSVSPPHSAGCRSSCVISVRTRVGSAPSLSILLTATRMGTSAAREWSTASRVCGMTPSSAATTTTEMSATWPPRARMAVKASWPGVSRNVIVRSPWWTW